MRPHRLHILTLPHTQTTREFNHCAYTSKVRKFATMMTKAGHQTYLYAGDENEAECTELVPVMPREDQQKLLANEDWYPDRIQALPYKYDHPVWKMYAERTIVAMRERIQSPLDIICLVSSSQWPIKDSFPHNFSVETAVGYAGRCADYRIFESYAWMHTCYGEQMTAAGADGKAYHAVIPNFFEPSEFPYRQSPDQDQPYYLFMSRMTRRKGWEIAVEATRRAGARLVIAGAPGERPEEDHVDYVGLADTATRAQLMGNATAIFVPTLYVEPFGGVAVESMMCGTPVISTDFGAFTEIVRQGVDGYRCHIMSDFIKAMEDVKDLNRLGIRLSAIRRYATWNLAPRFTAYFDRLLSLWGRGFYA